MKPYRIVDADVKFQGKIVKEGSVIVLSDDDAKLIGKYAQPVDGVVASVPSTVTGGGEATAPTETEGEEASDSQPAASGEGATTTADSPTTNKKGKQ